MDIKDYEVQISGTTGSYAYYVEACDPLHAEILAESWALDVFGVDNYEILGIREMATVRVK